MEICVAINLNTILLTMREQLAVEVKQMMMLYGDLYSAKFPAKTAQEAAQNVQRVTLVLTLGKP